ncbi:type I-E CRISPR-associated protein Cse2/CasB [Serratia aquatilis]|uniref:Type I-E CRISPR-associated protein Cse2/CasB n=1 Tax=Serratia aquatilis TaxID=1737515 RepID=A0ABV6E7F5_9GAMM
MLDSNTSQELVIYSQNAKDIVNGWFNDLQQRDHSKSFNGRLWRAELRRAKDIYQVITTQGFRALLNKLEKVLNFQQSDILALAIFASVAAHARRINNQRSFAAQLGTDLKGKPCLSALRFDRLIQARQPEEFCAQLIRAVKLRGDEGVNITSLADGVFLWMREWQARQEHQALELNPFKRNDVRWSSEYLMASEKN